MKFTFLGHASRRTLIVSVASLSLSSPALAASFSVPPDSATTAKTVVNNDTGSVGAGNTLSVTGTAITWMTGANAPGVVITNSGTITATSRGIDTATTALNGNFTLQNNAGATLTSANDAFRIQSASVGAVTVNNLGTIQSTTNGRAFDFNAVTSTGSAFAITNGVNATIRALGNDGIRVGAGATTITNSGLIEAPTATYRAIRMNTNLANVTSVSIVNNAGAAIQSSDDAIQINGSSGSNATTAARFSIDNAGTIRSATGQALDFDNLTSTAATVTITNRATGVITTDNADAIRPGQNFTINNYGQIIANALPVPTDRPGADGIDLQLNHTGTVNNFAGGLISGAKSGTSSDVGSVITVYNEAGATIIGRNGSGVGSGGNAVVTNYGTLTGAIDTTSARGDGDGIDSDFLLTLTNYGLVQGTGSKGVDAGGQINNSEGVAIGGGTIRNYGTITGAGAGLVVNNDSNTDNSRGGSGALDLVNYAGGTIVGRNSYAIRAENKTGTAIDNDTIVNYGTLIGNGIIPDPNGVVVLANGNPDPGSVGTLNGVTYTGTGATRFIRGDGAAVQTGEGNDVLSNYGAIIGNTGRAISMEGGNDTLNLYTGSSIAGRIDGGVGANTINLFSSGSGTGTLANVINFQALNVAGGIWSLLDSQSYASGVAIASGATLRLGNGGTAGAVTGNVANNGALAFNRSDALSFGGIISGTGAVSQIGTGTTTLTAANTYTGATTVSAGTLAIAAGGSLASRVANSATFTNAGVVAGGLTQSAGIATNTGTIGGATAIAGGVFTGTGTTASLSVSGGTFAPGDGTAGSSARVTGSLTLASAATYLVQVNPTIASTTNVGGTANLGGAAVSANFANGSYIARRYAILTAAGGVSGAFGTLTSTNLPANFTASLGADATNAYLTLTPNFGGGLNQNQQAVAATLVNYFNTTGGIPTAFGTLSPAGLTQASGEIGTGAQQATIMAMDLFLGLVTDPFAAGRGEVFAPAGGAMGYADDALAYAGRRKAHPALAAIHTKAPPLRTAPERAWSMWSAGFGGAQGTAGNAAVGSNSATSRIYGGVVGLDYRVAPHTLLGVALAGGGTNYAVASSGTGRSDLFQAGAYLRHSIGASYLTAALAYGWQDVTTERNVGADRLTGRFSTDTLAGRVEAGRRFVTPWAGGVGVTPYAAGQFTSISLPSYRETAGAGAGTFGLAYAGKQVTATRSELGLRTDRSFAVHDGVLTLRGRAAWAHNFDPDRSIAATFQALPGASFVVNGAAQARNAALVSASAEMKWLSGWALAATFEGEFSNVTDSYAGKGVVRYAW